MKIFNKIIILLVIIVSLFLIPACNTTDTGNNTNTGNNGTNTTGYTDGTPNATNIANQNISGYRLYFGNSGYTSLVTEERDFTNSAWNAKNNLEDMANEALNSLITGPKTNNNYAVLPNTTKVNYVKNEGDGILHVDFSDGFIDGYKDLGTPESMTVYSIVNTLTDLDGVKKVRLTINDQPFKINNQTWKDDLIRDTSLISYQRK